jgi:hypothetical protein
VFQEPGKLLRPMRLFTKHLLVLSLKGFNLTTYAEFVTV